MVVDLAFLAPDGAFPSDNKTMFKTMLLFNVSPTSESPINTTYNATGIPKMAPLPYSTGAWLITLSIVGFFVGLIFIGMASQWLTDCYKIALERHRKEKRRKKFKKRDEPELIPIETKRTKHGLCTSNGYENQAFELQKNNSIPDFEMEVGEKIQDTTKNFISVQNKKCDYQNNVFKPATRRGDSQIPSIEMNKIDEEMEIDYSNGETSSNEKGVTDVGTQDISIDVDDDSNTDIDCCNAVGTENLAFALEENNSNRNRIHDAQHEDFSEAVLVHPPKINGNTDPPDNADEENCPSKITNSTTINIDEGAGNVLERKSNRSVDQSLSITGDNVVFEGPIIYV